jgi:hypothetical protein
MEKEFKAIRILPFTEAERKQLIGGADDPAKTYTIPFKFSSAPDPQWAEAFLLNWHKEYGGGYIPRIEGGAVYVESSIRNLQSALNGVKLVAAETNDRFAAAAERRRREAEEARRLKDETKRAAEAAMADALDKLQF